VKRNWLRENIDWVLPFIWILVLFIWGLVIVVQNAHAETRLNVVTGASETVPSGDWNTQLNPVTGKASVQPQDANVELNVITGEAEWDSGHQTPSEE